MEEVSSLETGKLIASRERFKGSREGFKKETFLSNARKLAQTTSLLHLAERAERFYASLEKDKEASSLVEKNNREALVSHLRDEYQPLFNLVGKLPGMEKKRDRIEEEVGEIAFSYLAKMGSLAPEKKRFGEEALAGTIQLLIRESPSFSSLKDEEGEPLPLEEIVTRHNELLTREAVSELDPRVVAFAQRRWMIEQKRRGEKVFLTPYYQGILALSQRLERKENGIGGRIFYGPPGTGKTELGIKVNEGTGFKTHVINLHRDMAFMNLIGQEKIPVGIDRTASLMQRLTAASVQIKEWTPKEFWEATQGLASSLQVEPLELLGRFLPEIQEGQEITEESMKKFREGYLSYLRTQILAASMGEKAGLAEEETWVNGEILNAIERGEKPYFTEIDKAGPHTLDGLLHLLTRSPGEEVTFGTKKVQIPSWLSIDGDCNLLKLGGEKAVLYNRFNEIYLGYPPVKDELMIASVWLSDNEGNIVLKPYEEWQMVGFFLYVLPEIRVLYEHLGEGVIEQPFSLRNTKELCGLLVDPKTHKRTKMSVGRAIEASLFELRTFAQKEEGRKALREILSKYQQFLSEEVEEIGKPVVPPSPEYSKEAVRVAALSRIVASPIMWTIATLPGETTEIAREISFVKEKLSQEEMAEIKKRLPQKRELILPNGLQATLVGEKDGVFLALNAFLGEGDIVELQKFLLGKEEEKVVLRGISEDGRVVLLEKSHKGKKIIFAKALTGTFVDDKGERFSEVEFGESNADVQVNLAPSGAWLTTFTPASSSLKLFNLSERRLIDFSERVRSYEFTPDSQFLLVETLEGETWFIDMESVRKRKVMVISRPRARLSGRGWRVASEELIVNPPTLEAVLIKKE